MIDALIKQQPENQNRTRERGVLLADLADVLVDQGKYAQAREAYEDALKIAQQQDDLRGQAVIQGQLGKLAVEQHDYAEAQLRHNSELERFRDLNEPTAEAIAWHHLGIVAQRQEEWVDAERCYRESLTINERLGNTALAGMVCNQLAIVSEGAGRLVEAEGWYKRALERYEQTNPGGFENAMILSYLANLLMNEVRAGHAATTRLAEAKRYAEQALPIIETLDESDESWLPRHVLAKIADMEGHAEEARDYRRLEREAYVAFSGHSYHIDRQHGQLIAAIAAAAQGDAQTREAVEAALPRLEERGWKIAAATRRIWSGERDWHSLAEGIDSNSALLILRVLETIAQPPAEAVQPAAEEVFASLPPAIREAIERGDEVAFQRAVEALSPEEQQGVLAAIRYLQEQTEEESEETEEE